MNQDSEGKVLNPAWVTMEEMFSIDSTRTSGRRLAGSRELPASLRSTGCPPWGTGHRACTPASWEGSRAGSGEGPCRAPGFSCCLSGSEGSCLWTVRQDAASVVL